LCFDHDVVFHVLAPFDEYFEVLIPSTP